MSPLQLLYAIWRKFMDGVYAVGLDLNLQDDSAHLRVS